MSLEIWLNELSSRLIRMQKFCGHQGSQPSEEGEERGRSPNDAKDVLHEGSGAEETPGFRALHLRALHATLALAEAPKRPAA